LSLLQCQLIENMPHVVAAAGKSIDRIIVMGMVRVLQLAQGLHGLRILVPIAVLKRIARYRQHFPVAVPARRIGQRGLLVQCSVWPRNQLPLLVRKLFPLPIRSASQDQHLLFGWRHRQSPLDGENTQSCLIVASTRLAVQRSSSLPDTARKKRPLISFPVCSLLRACDAAATRTMTRRQHSRGHLHQLCRHSANCCTRPSRYGCTATPATTV